MHHAQPHKSPLDQRRAGVLMHPTSLPGGHCSGDLGPEAYRFVDFLAEAGFSVWQTLPLGPTHSDLSPYQARSAHAGNPWLISVQRIVERGWLPEIPQRGEAETLEEAHRRCLREAHAGFWEFGSEDDHRTLAAFELEHNHWLEDYALFEAVRSGLGEAAWWDWPEALRDREPLALTQAARKYQEAVSQCVFEQYVFFQQWRELKHYANERGVMLFGDLPLYVAEDSAEVWADRKVFRLDANGRPEVVAGVPPDFFSATGQRWGNPLYNWQALREDGFGWWVSRVATQLEMFDLLRIDHFRGLQAYWEIPAGSDTAIDGRWVEAPGAELLQVLIDRLPALALVAEDLGVITPEVDALREQFDLPGMKILQFAFDGGADNPYLPHSHHHRSVVYTGTHDNDTTCGWFEALSEPVQVRVLDYLGCQGADMPLALNRAALASVADLAMLPFQDLLELGGEHRMNTPGVPEGNWTWRFDWSQLPDGLAGQYRDMLGLYGRIV